MIDFFNRVGDIIDSIVSFVQQAIDTLTSSFNSFTESYKLVTDFTSSLDGLNVLLPALFGLVLFSLTLYLLRDFL